MNSFLEILRRQPRCLVVSEALALVGLIGWIDHQTGWEWNFFAPFALPLILVTWKTGLRLGFAFAVLCALTFWLAHAGNHPYHTASGLVLSVFGRLFYFAALVIAVAALKAQNQSKSERIAVLEHMQALEREHLGTREHEQQRLGRDLHDNLGPHLAAIGYAATFHADDLRARGEAAAVKAEQIRDLVSEAVSLTRDLARGINPVPMPGHGLALALDDLAGTTARVSGLSIAFRESGDPQLENAEASLHFYRIAQEALQNAIRHGMPQKITVILSQSEDAIRLEVVDDGKGMTLPNGARSGMGLHSMRYRANALGAELKIDSNPGGGTVVSCEMPNQPAAPLTATT